MTTNSLSYGPLLKKGLLYILFNRSVHSDRPASILPRISVTLK